MVGGIDVQLLDKIIDGVTYTEIAVLRQVVLGSSNISIENNLVSLKPTINVSNISTLNLTTENGKIYKYNNSANVTAFGHKNSTIEDYAITNNTLGNTRLNGKNRIDFCVNNVDVINLTSELRVVGDFFGMPLSQYVAILNLPNGEMNCEVVTIKTANIVELEIPENSLPISKITGLQTIIANIEARLDDLEAYHQPFTPLPLP